ncbi:MAG: hypothetical protein KBB37_07200 [Bacteroidia bacterium]|nr:hypothetical protein [Bacteroidia bacterium]MBP7261056.1 hypothetical protein [Bacteroidia bacterium]MBP9178981.1 hypothetical protein [Bacteroidia bacterium]MBP9723282.1 hypothetical protein [Bacteroidia bacterium]
MIKTKYNYKDFIEVYISFMKCYNETTQEREYYSMLYTALSDYFEIDIAVTSFEDNDETVFEGRNMKNEGIAFLNTLIKEYNLIENIFIGKPLYVTGLTDDFHRKFDPIYSNNTSARKKLLFKMIDWLCRETFGSNKKTITHRKLIIEFHNLFLFEMKLNPVLEKLYNAKSELKNEDKWSVNYYKDELAKEGYTCVLPELNQTIVIGNYQIKGVEFDGIAYSVKPINQ